MSPVVQYLVPLRYAAVCTGRKCASVVQEESTVQLENCTKPSSAFVHAAHSAFNFLYASPNNET